MNNKLLDVIAFGSCYIDINAEGFAFDESGIPTESELIGDGYEVVPGGSAVNFCVLLQKLGLKTGFIGMAGADIHGQALSELLHQRGITPELIQRPDLQTNLGFNMTSPQGEHIMLVAGTANAALQPEAVLPQLEEAATTARGLYIGGCFKLKAFMHAFSQIADLAKRHSAVLIVDHGRIPKGTDPTMKEAVKDLVMQAQYYFPSRKEFCELWDTTSIESGLALLHEKAPNLNTIVKDGANGAYYWADGTVQHAAPIAVEKIINVTGAGDSFNAGTMKAIFAGQSVSEAARYGCEVAAAKITGRKPL